MGRSCVILIVEDDRDIREDLADLLRDEGYDILTASNGAEALALLEQKIESGGDPPHLILLDLMMPEMNGWDFRANQMRAAALAEVPVVILSGISDARYHADLLHAADCLTKPIKLERLLNVVARHC